MPLPAPNLDDRRFQDLVDDAKRLVQQHCPEWSDHNVSDPGVTLIELFAWMTDQLLYRLNRVPEKNYVKFLELIGLRRYPPAAATAAVTFWLSTDIDEPFDIPRATVVATRRTETEEPIEFTTVDDLALVPARVLTVRSSTEPDRSVERMDELMKGTGFSCFSPQPKSGDQLLIGLVAPVPKCAVVVRMRCTIEGIGVDPDHPPLVWEAWTGDDWERCEVDSDSTGGINRDGEVVLHVPRTHEASLIAKQRAGWIRARVVEPVENQPFYSASPQIFEITAATIGGTEVARNASLIEEEYLGNSDGSPGQRFQLTHENVVPTDEAHLEVAEGEGWERWVRVDDFAESGPNDPHYLLDGVDGELRMGPAVRLEDGTLQQFGRIPAKGATFRLRSFSSGGGAQGNVNKGAIAVLKTTLPYVDRVENRRGAIGGRDAEDLDNAKLRGPLLLRTRNRAVTAEDFEYIAGAAAPEIARVRCVAAGTDPSDAGAVRVLIVPDLPDEFGRLRFERLLPSDESLGKIGRALDARRLIGTRVSVEPPFYQGITVVARIRPKRQAHPARLQEQALTALYRYFNPLTGGPEETGWPFGRPIMVGEVYSVLQRLAGVELVDDARLFPADPVTGRRGEATQRIEIDPNALVFSYEHQVLVEAAL